MQRQKVLFREFRKQFYDNPNGGYYPVHSCIGEGEDGKAKKTLCIDLICEWRLADGKVLFIEVPFDSEEEFMAIIEYLDGAHIFLTMAIVNNINRLRFNYPK